MTAVPLKRGWMAFLVLIGAAGINKAHSNACLGGNADLQVLPARIGDPGSQWKSDFPLKCDTVYVPRGATTTVHPGVLLHFARPRAGNVIKVEGTLKLKGTKDLYVTVAASQRGAGSLEPGEGVWSGVVVEPGGKLEAEFAGFFHAPTAITAFSESVNLTNTYFKGSTALRLPDGTLHELDPTFTAVNEMDFSRALTPPEPERVAAPSAQPDKEIPLEGRLSAEEKQAILNAEAPASSGGGGLWWWVLGGGAAIGAAGGTYLYLQAGGSDEPGTDGNPDFQLDPLPGLPGSP